MTEPTTALNDLDFMTALLGLLIPGTAGDVPGAGELGLAAEVVASIQADPALGPMAEAGAQAVYEAAGSDHPEGLAGLAPEAGTQVIEDQLGTHPFFIMGILRHLYPAYYQRPEVLTGIGEEPRPPFPEGFDVEPTDAELLKKLQVRRKA